MIDLKRIEELEVPFYQQLAGLPLPIAYKNGVVVGDANMLTLSGDLKNFAYVIVNMFSEYSCVMNDNDYLMLEYNSSLYNVIGDDNALFNIGFTADVINILRGSDFGLLFNLYENKSNFSDEQAYIISIVTKVRALDNTTEFFIKTFVENVSISKTLGIMEWFGYNLNLDCVGYIDYELIRRLDTVSKVNDAKLFIWQCDNSRVNTDVANRIFNILVKVASL